MEITELAGISEVGILGITVILLITRGITSQQKLTESISKLTSSIDRLSQKVRLLENEVRNGNSKHNRDNA